jgi:GT2 family glycosyltransferase
MHESNVSIIIPTYNRKDVLMKTLEAYSCQSARNDILEILVIDDGSIDGTGRAVSERMPTYPITLRVISKANRGPAAARNLGMHEAHAEIVLFGDDDIFPARNMVEQHLAWHRKYPGDSVGVLGYVTWDPALLPTPFMRWLGEFGPLFNFGLVSKGEVDFTYFYSCNVSLKPSFLRSRRILFDEDFRGAAYEDTELGYRLQQNGFRLLYNPDAIGYHHKTMSFADACRRADALEEAFEILKTKEAGAYLERIGAGTVSPGAIRKFLRRRAAFFLQCLKPVVDTRFPLPRRVYNMLYRQYLESRRARVVRGSKPMKANGQMVS